PDRVAYRFLKDGETESKRLTYGELDQQARAIAVLLQGYCQAGDRAVLVYPYEAGLEFIAAFLGCLYAGVVAVSCHPPRNRHGLSDLQARLVSSGAHTLLTTNALAAKLTRQLSAPEATPLHWLATDAMPHSAAADWSARPITAATLAFLQYTSGSTGQPKGVMVTHDRLLYNQRVLQQAFGHSDRSIGVGWLPLFHDMGLIGNVLQAIYLGTSCVLMSPIDFVQKPLRWLQAVSHYQATTSGGPNFAYDLLCRQVTDAQLATLDLSHWQVAFCGAEPVRLDTLERFATKFAPCGFRREAFYPCYGMAEATLFISGGSRAEFPRTVTVDGAALAENRVVVVDSPSPNVAAASGLTSSASPTATPESSSASEEECDRLLVSCGHAWLDGQLAIADPDSQRRCAADQVGEIWVASAGIGSGYWQQPEETERTFGAYLSDTGEGPFLRTGDLGFLHQGELFITGRLHDVMVFWGLNHYPQHIEETVARCHPGFLDNGTAAISVTVDGEARLVIVQEIERRYCSALRNGKTERLTVSEVVEVIRWQVFEQHFVDVYAIALVKPGAIPRTSSGKVQRSACRAAFTNGSLETLDEWRSPHSERYDITSLIERYLNPITHVKRYSALAKGRLQRLLASIG
ncbi:MAG TPA: fatty acyl-AMP ligase, partial [Chroococcidiopsis sp.]